MKQCPVCKTTYTDPTLLFCLADGASLVGGGAGNVVTEQHSDPTSDPTVVMQTRRQMQVDIPQQQPAAPPAPAPAPVAAPSGGTGTLLKVLAAVLVLGVLVIALVAAGALVYFNSGRSEVATINAVNNSKTQTTPTAEPTTANDTDELRAQIANLQRMINEQKKTSSPNLSYSEPERVRTVRVNSPGDGFLALRTLPNSETGARIAQIPHGTTIAIGGCLNNSARIGGRPGRWCRSSYAGLTGWVFDGFVVY
ncbi:MAG: hypothetical protein ABR530_00475 [Pyrinomonadaceae bacterium]